MSTSFRNIVIVGRHDDPRVTEPLAHLSAHLTKAGASLLASEEIDDADLVIAIGGDGLPLIVYHDRDPIRNVRVAHCGDVACSNP